MPKYKKAPKFEGKDLTLNIGRSDKKILDGVEYPDPRLARFVGMGFMVEVTAEKKAPAAEVKTAVLGEVTTKESVTYTESDLQKLNKGDLVQVADDDFGLELEPDMLKADMVSAILDAQKR